MNARVFQLRGGDTLVIAGDAPFEIVMPEGFIQAGEAKLQLDSVARHAERLTTAVWRVSAARDVELRRMEGRE